MHIRVKSINLINLMMWRVISMFQLRVTLEQNVKAMYRLAHYISFSVSISGWRVEATQLSDSYNVPLH